MMKLQLVDPGWKQITFSKKKITSSFWGICFSNSILGAACDRSYVENRASHCHTPVIQAKTSETLMIFWVTLISTPVTLISTPVTLISTPVSVLNAVQSESMLG
jgi:hypothetical protein